MNTMTFVFGQLLTSEMLSAGRQPPWQRLYSHLQQRLPSSQPWKELFMDNSILFIAFLIVSLLANFAMPTRAE
jgi:hypothetical protein